METASRFFTTWGERLCCSPGGILPKGTAIVDPVVRARLLIKVVEMGENLLNLPTTPQETSLGLTVHFTHPTVRRAALDQVSCE